MLTNASSKKSLAMHLGYGVLVCIFAYTKLAGPQDQLLGLEHHKRHFTFAGNGTCSPPEQLENGLTHVHCLGAGAILFL